MANRAKIPKPTICGLCFKEVPFEEEVLHPRFKAVHFSCYQDYEEFDLGGKPRGRQSARNESAESGEAAL